jgi:hypothetical protein
MKSIRPLYRRDSLGINLRGNLDALFKEDYQKKVVAFSSSPRRDGNTAILIRHVFGELEKRGIEIAWVEDGGMGA